MRRNPRGTGILFCVIGLFVLLPLAFATFEVWRFVEARAQMQYICDAAALCATANLLKGGASDSIIPLEAAAVDAAKFTVRSNTILGAPLSNIRNLAGNSVPAAGEVALQITFVDAQRQELPFAASGAKGAVVKAVYGYRPMTAQYLGLGAVPMGVSSEGGIPPVDLVLCFDVSASMDDATAVTAVKRFWNGTEVAYFTPPSANGSILDIVRPGEGGTKVNAVGPQNLSTLTAGSNGSVIAFSEAQSSGVKGLRALGGNSGPAETGLPPGNYDAANAGSVAGNGIDPASKPNTITDLVVNLDGKKTFGGWTDPETGLAFPNTQTLVEAARGNLNSDSAMRSALVAGGARPAWLPASAPNPLYQKVYFAQANRMVQPMEGAKSAAIQILRALDQSTDLNCGLVSFSDTIGFAPDTTWGTSQGGTTYFIDSNWAPGGTGNYPLPLLQLNSGQPNIIGRMHEMLRPDRWLCQPAMAQSLPTPPTATSVAQTVSSLVATGKSNVAAALEEAISELSDTSKTRPDSEKVILLISDGKPELPGGGGSSSSPAAEACYMQARNAREQGIRIVTLDVATTSDAAHAETLQKVADLSKGYYVAGTSDAQLNLALRKIVTQLVALR